MEFYKHTFEDFCHLVKDRQKADLIDGVIYLASFDSTVENDLFVWLICLIADYLEIFSLGKVFGPRVAFKLDKYNSPEPDIGVILKKRMRLIKPGQVDGPPDLALEIVSLESAERDYVKKLLQYQEFGVKEYWIIDEMNQSVTAFRLGKDRRFRKIRLRNGRLHSNILPGFWVNPAWLWQSPLPKKMLVFQSWAAI